MSKFDCIQYELDYAEKMALLVLLTEKIEKTPENKVIFQEYNERDLYEIVFLKLFKPGNYSEERCAKRINKLYERLIEFRDSLTK